MMSTTFRLKNVLIGTVGAVITLGLMSGSVLAHDDPIHYDHSKEPHESPHKAEPPPGGHPSLAEAATNPISNLMQIQLQNAYHWKNYNSHGYANTSVIQPVIPIPLPYKKVPLLITRTTLPYVTTPDLHGEGRVSGFGDLTFLALGNFKVGEKQTAGLGVSTVFPTAGDNEFVGSGKYSAGPAAIYINQQIPKLQFGMVAWQHWSYASGRGGSDREHVSELSFQPFITKHFDKGWYVGTADDPHKYDFKTDKFSWNLGPQVGRVFKLGKLPVKLFGQVAYNPQNDAGSIPEWTFKINLTLLFPE